MNVGENIVLIEIIAVMFCLNFKVFKFLGFYNGQVTLGAQGSASSGTTLRRYRLYVRMYVSMHLCIHLGLCKFPLNPAHNLSFCFHPMYVATQTRKDKLL